MRVIVFYNQNKILSGMTKPVLAAMISLAALLYSPAHARTNLEEDWTDNPTTQRYKQQQYAARTECEVPNSVSSPSSTPLTSATPTNPSLLERLSEALKDDCGKVRVDKNEIVCEDYVRCTKEEITGKEYDDPNSICVEYYCPTSTTWCTEWQMKERWRFNPHTLGKVEALLIDTKFVNDVRPPLSLGYALRPIGENEEYALRTEHAARRVKNLINYDL